MEMFKFFFSDSVLRQCLKIAVLGVIKIIKIMTKQHSIYSNHGRYYTYITSYLDIVSVEITYSAVRRFIEVVIVTDMLRKNRVLSDDLMNQEKSKRISNTLIYNY